MQVNSLLVKHPEEREITGKPWRNVTSRTQSVSTSKTWSSACNKLSKVQGLGIVPQIRKPNKSSEGGIINCFFSPLDAETCEVKKPALKIRLKVICERKKKRSRLRLQYHASLYIDIHKKNLAYRATMVSSRPLRDLANQQEYRQDRSSLPASRGSDSGQAVN